MALRASSRSTGRSTQASGRVACIPRRMCTSAATAPSYRSRPHLRPGLQGETSGFSAQGQRVQGLVKGMQPASRAPSLPLLLPHLRSGVQGETSGFSAEGQLDHGQSATCLLFANGLQNDEGQASSVKGLQPGFTCTLSAFVPPPPAIRGAG